MAYDYIIIGTGAGGSVLADRLSRSGQYQILVLEAGGSDWDPMHRIPKGFYFTMQNPRNTRGLTTQPFGDGTTETWQRGWLTGGSTTINGAVWNRGDPQAFDLWEERGTSAGTTSASSKRGSRSKATSSVPTSIAAGAAQ